MRRPSTYRKTPCRQGRGAWMREMSCFLSGQVVAHPPCEAFFSSPPGCWTAGEIGAFSPGRRAVPALHPDRRIRCRLLLGTPPGRRRGRSTPTGLPIREHGHGKAWARVGRLRAFDRSGSSSVPGRAEGCRPSRCADPTRASQSPPQARPTLPGCSPYPTPTKPPPGSSGAG